MSETLTAEQAAAVFAESSVAVVAGAGTGKTKMLAHRYLHHIDSGLSPLQVVAVTFTEKAAAELRARVRSLARSERPDNRRALIELEAAQISTIHALAARICREHPQAAGVPADFRVLDDFERAVWKRASLEDALAALPRSVLEQLPVRLLRIALAALLDDPVLAEVALEKGPEQWRQLLEREQTEALALITDDPAWRANRDLLRSLSGPPDDPAERAREACLGAMRALEARDAASALELVKTFRTDAGRQANWPGGELPALRAALKQVKAVVTEACADGPLTLAWGPADERLAAVTPALRAAFAAARDHVEASKRRQRVLDFPDLERHALRALEHEDVVAHYAARWRALLVDEFQDTNAVQAALLARLERAALLTIVGDEKQAIYGFRGADVALFRRYQADIESRGGARVVLRSTFRSHAGLVDATAALFADLLGDLDQPVTAVRQAAPNSGAHLSFHALVSDGRPNVAARRLAEAREIARLVRELIDSGHPVHDPAGGGWRPVRFGDIAILARGRAPFATYSQVLPALGVPTVDTGGGDLLQTREAKDALAALRFLADPSDDVAVAAVLRSPFFAVDDRALHAFASGLRDGRWWAGLERASGAAEAVGQNVALPASLASARRALADVLAQRWSRPPSALLQALDEATGYSAVIANLPGGRRRLSDWRAFAALVRTLEAGQADAFTVNRSLRQLQLAGVEVPRATLQAGDAVALMTIHKSKGLEWPVVIVADLSYQGGGNDPGDVVFDPEHGVGLRFGEISGDEPGGADPSEGSSDDGVSTLHRLLVIRRRREEARELRRLLYVALTRARDRLILTTSEPEAGPMKVLGPALMAAGVSVTPFAFDPSLAFPDPPLPQPGELGLRLEPELAAYDAAAVTSAAR